jgi:TP901 family phage tail tape measure protein
VDKLQLEVILSAIDRATRPLRSITKESGALAKGLRKSRDDLAALNALQSRVTGFKKLRNDVDASRQALAAATQRMKAVREATAAVAEPTRRMALEMERAERVVNKSKNAHIANLGALRRSREGLQAAGIATAKLSDHERELAARIGRANGVIDQQTAKLRSLAEANRRVQRAQDAMQNAQTAAGNLRSMGASSMVGGAAVAAGPIAAIRAASDYEQAMLGVARQVEGARDGMGQLTPLYKAISVEIMRMSQRLPMASTEIAALVASGARMGIQGKENLLAFAETTAIAANAFDLPTDEIGDNMAKISALYKIPIKNINQLGDTLNWLDDQALSKGGDIIDVMQRMGDVADRMDYKQAAAFGSTFLSLGSAPEIAASATKALVRELSIAAVQPKKFQSAMKDLGLDSADIQKRMTTDAAGTIQMVLERINAAAPDQRVSLATRIFGKEFGDDATKLALNLGELRRQIGLTNDPQAKGSMGRENEARLQTLAARWALLKNQLFNTAVVVGTSLAPSMIKLMTTAGVLLTRVQAWVQENPELAAGLAKAALSGGVLLTVFGALSIGLSAIVGPLGVVRYGITALSVRFGPLLRMVMPLARNALPMLMHGLRLMVPLVAGISAPLWLIIGAVGALAIVIYKYWGPIRAFLGGLFDGLMASLSPVMAEMRTALEPLRPVWDALGSAIGVVWGWIKQLITPYQATNGELQNAARYGQMFAAVLSNTLVPALSVVVWAVGLAAKFFRVAFDWSPAVLIARHWGAVTAFFNAVPARMRAIGAMIIDGLSLGIQSRFGALFNVAKRVTNLLTGTTNKGLEVKSPSRVFMRIGQYTAEGLALGIAGRADLPVRAIDRLQGRVRAAGDALARGAAGGPAAPRLGAAGGTGGQGGGLAGGNHYTINLYGISGEPDAIKRAVREGIAEADRAKQTRSRSALADSGD